MNLEIFEKSNRTRIGMIKTYDFVQYEDEFNGEGSFEIQMPTTEESLMYLTFGNFIFFEDGVVGIIKYKNDTEDDGTRITIKGKLTNNILSFRSFLLTASYYGTLSENSRQMVSDLMINNENEERNIYFVKLSTDEKYIPSSDKVRVQNTGDKLSKVISEMFLPYGFGYEMYPVIKDYDELFFTEQQIINYNENLSYYNELAKKLGIEFLCDDIDFFKKNISIFGDRSNNNDLRCVYPSFCSFIDAPTGFVYPCDCSIHRDRTIYKIGELKEHSMNEIWNGEKRKVLKKKLLNSELNCKTKCDEANCQFNYCYFKQRGE